MGLWARLTGRVDRSDAGRDRDVRDCARGRDEPPHFRLHVIGYGRRRCAVPVAIVPGGDEIRSFIDWQHDTHAANLDRGLYADDLGLESDVRGVIPIPDPGEVPDRSGHRG